MPYIDPVRRLQIGLGRDDDKAATIGECTFVITEAAMEWVRQAPPSYERYNAAIGALECAKLELYRRLVAPYEDQKCAENGDVYP